MQKNFALVSVFILFAGLKGGIMNCTDGETLAIKILSFAFPVVCLILLTIRHSLPGNDPDGNKIAMIHATFIMLPVISTQKNEITTG
jgi:hypothetical protein